jgi:hypothetical protein
MRESNRNCSTFGVLADALLWNRSELSCVDDGADRATGLGSPDFAELLRLARRQIPGPTMHCVRSYACWRDRRRETCSKNG